MTQHTLHLPPGSAERMRTMAFTPNVSAVDDLAAATHTIEALAAEVGVYSATPYFAREHGGPILNSILDLVPTWYYDDAESRGLYPNIDCRIHRLYPGDYPAYPGWHCDGVFRETYFCQPETDRVECGEHLICTVSTHEGGVSNCQFLDERFTATVDVGCPEINLWGQVHRQVTAREKKSVLDTVDGRLYHFDPQTLHRVMPATIRGWRLFFRMSQWHRPNLGEGQISRQEQVYKLAEGGGW